MNRKVRISCLTGLENQPGKYLGRLGNGKAKPFAFTRVFKQGLAIFAARHS